LDETDAGLDTSRNSLAGLAQQMGACITTSKPGGGLCIRVKTTVVHKLYDVDSEARRHFVNWHIGGEGLLD